MITKELIVYREFEDSELLEDMSRFMGNEFQLAVDKAEMQALAYKCIHQLLEMAGNYGFSGNLWHCYLTNLLVNNENSYSRSCEIRGKIEGTINEAVLHDIIVFRRFFAFNYAAVMEKLGVKEYRLIEKYQASTQESRVYNSRIRDRICTLAGKLAGSLSPEEMKETLTGFYQEYGVGKFGLHKAFRVEPGENGARIVPISNIAHVHLDDLIGYEIPKKS